MAFDPLSLDSDTENEVEYWWYGFLNTAPQVEVLKWFGAITNIAPFDNLMPSKFDLTQNYPNPFNPSTVIKYSVPEANTLVTIDIYNSIGQKISTLVKQVIPAGSYEVQFDAEGITSGIYFYTLKAGNFVETKKMVLMK